MLWIGPSAARFIDCDEVNSCVKQFGSIQVRGAGLKAPQILESPKLFYGLSLSALIICVFPIVPFCACKLQPAWR